MDHRNTDQNSAADWQSRWVGRALGAGAYVVAFVSAALLSRWLTTTPGYTPLWFPAGVSLAVFACSSKRNWPTLLVATTVATYLFNGVIQPKPSAMVFGFWLANLSRTLVGATLLQWAMPGRLRLDEPRRLFWFIFVACVPAPLPCALFATWGIVWSTPGSAYQIFPTIYAGNMVGMIVAAPLTMVLMDAFRVYRIRQRKSLTPRIPSEKIFGRRLVGRDLAAGVVLLLGTAALSGFVFYLRTEPLSYLLLPCLLLLALQFEVAGVSVGLFLLTVITMACTASGHGGFAEGRELPWRLTLSQLYLTTCGVSFFTLAVSLAQQRRLSGRLRRIQSKLTHVSDETKLILDAIPAMVFYKNDQNHVVRVNRSAKQWLETIGRSLQDAHQPEIPADAIFVPSAQSDWQVLQTGQAKLACEERVDLPGGKTRWVLADRIPLPAQPGRHRGLVAVWTDITQRKQVEDALTESNQDLERFASVASHDLKEPLRAIGGYCRLLEEDFGATLNDDGKRYVRSAIQGAERMNRLVDDLLEYSRVSRAALNLQAVSLAQVAEEALEILEKRIEESDARVEIGDLPAVIGSLNPLVQVFQNLLSNAIKFVAPGQRPQIKIESSCLGNYYRITVRDRGIGIDPKEHQHVFDIFSRLNHRRDYDGTGLGLAICKRVMQRLGGKITIDAPAGGGTAVQLWFPVLDGQGLSVDQDATPTVALTDTPFLVEHRSSERLPICTDETRDARYRTA